MLKLGSVQRKILLLLAGGFALGLAYTPKQRYRIFRQLGEEWEKIDSNILRQAIDGLYKNKMIDLKENKDGSTAIIMLDDGRKRTLNYKLEEIKIKKPKQWDKKWRMVLFDIPSSKKKFRDILRFHLKRLGFYQYQKSVFIHPYECKNEIDFLVELYEIRPYVRQLVVLDIDNQLHLKEIFKKAL
ncbi:MAG: hypothetical protein AABX16_04365 [Nanoarchaeota archaeon]